MDSFLPVEETAVNVVDDDEKLARLLADYELTAGAHIRVECYYNAFKFYHHGIDAGDGSVYHFSLSGSEEPRVARVRRTSLVQFARRGQRIQMMHHALQDVAHVVLQRAHALLGADGYHLFCNNCEHFATYCATGKPMCKQVDARLRAVATTLRGVACDASLLAATSRDATLEHMHDTAAMLLHHAPHALKRAAIAALDSAACAVTWTADALQQHSHVLTAQMVSKAEWQQRALLHVPSNNDVITIDD